MVGKRGVRPSESKEESYLNSATSKRFPYVHYRDGRFSMIFPVEYSECRINRGFGSHPIECHVTGNLPRQNTHRYSSRTFNGEMEHIPRLKKNHSSQMKSSCPLVMGFYRHDYTWSRNRRHLHRSICSNCTRRLLHKQSYPYCR